MEPEDVRSFDTDNASMKCTIEETLGIYLFVLTDRDFLHGVTRYLPIFSERNSIDSFKNAVRSQIQASKAIRLQRYPSNHPVPIDHRITGNLMDKILTTGRISLERHLIRWRGNQFGRGKDRLCVCLEAFEQSHTLCADLAGITRFDINTMITESKWDKLDEILQ